MRKFVGRYLMGDSKSFHRVASRLAEDHSLILQPDVDDPFTDIQDLIRRLLPYHVFQIPKEDLDAMIHRPLLSSTKGKSKGTEADYVREDIAGMLFSVDLTAPSD